MANKRILKKQVRYICGDIALECAIALETIPDVDKKIMTEAIRDIAELQTKTLNKMSYAFDKIARDYDNKKQYRKEKTVYNSTAFKKLKVKFNESVLDIVKKMNSALPKKTTQE